MEWGTILGRWSGKEEAARRASGEERFRPKEWNVAGACLVCVGHVGGSVAGADELGGSRARTCGDS